MTSSDLLPVSREEMIAEVKREIEFRRRVYPRQVATGRMSQRNAERHIEVMTAVLALLEESRHGNPNDRT